MLSFDTRDQRIGRALYLKRRYETELVRNALDTLRSVGHLRAKPAGCVIDAGANIGVTCITLLIQNDFREAVAIEPDPRNFALLVRNVAQNGLERRIRCVAGALSAREGTALLETSATNWGDNRITDSAPDRGVGTGHATIPVRTLTLDTLVPDDVEVDLIWMDVQGHEGWSLDGARRLLARGVPVVAEFWPEGIARSGMTPEVYARLTAELFTHFYQGPDEEHQSHRFRKHPIAEITRLFEDNSGIAECNLLLVSER